MTRPASPFPPKMTRVERNELNQLLWARRILRQAPPERLQLAQTIEQLGELAGLPERGGDRPTAQKG